MIKIIMGLVLSMIVLFKVFQEVRVTSASHPTSSSDKAPDEPTKKDETFTCDADLPSPLLI
jgi:hypothetical protein